MPRQEGHARSGSGPRPLAETQGPEYWRSLEELAGSADFQEMLHREFPKGASEWLDSVSRRGFLKLMGASLAMAGMTACTKQPLEPIVPYVKQPEEVIPGRPLFFATAFTLGGYASRFWSRATCTVPPRLKATTSIRQAWRHRCFRPGLDPGYVRSRPLADHHLSRRCSHLGHRWLSAMRGR